MTTQTKAKSQAKATKTARKSVFEIKSRYHADVILYSGEHNNLRDAVEAAVMEKVSLAGADLADADLTGANLTGAKLAYAKGLPKAPIIPDIDTKILDAIKLGGVLNMDTWHGDGTCGTTHCRAGWAIHLAGTAGKDLEAETTPYLAGRLIYEASRPGKPCPDFFASNDVALASIQDDAKAEDQA